MVRDPQKPDLIPQNDKDWPPALAPDPDPPPRPEPRLSPSSSPGPGPSSEPRPRPSSYKCGKCPARFESRRELHAHTMSDHPQVGGGALQPRPFADEVAPWVGDNGEVDERLRNCYNTNSPLILTPNVPGKVDSAYNVPMHPGMTVHNLEQSLLEIFNGQTRAFKINLSFRIYYETYRNQPIQIFSALR